MDRAARRQQWVGYAFIAPATLHLIVFALVPLGFSLYLSFFRWNLLRSEQQWLGLGNYAYSLSDPLFWNAMWNSTKFAVCSVPLGMIVGLAVAVLVHQKLRGMALFRTVFYVPAISSGVAIAMLWIYMYLPESGMINSMIRIGNRCLSAIGLSSAQVTTSTDFLKDPTLALYALVFMSIWVGLGPKMMLFLAGLVGISPTLYEAAELDGAGRWKSFWKVTLPMLAPTTRFVLVTSTIGAFQLFTPVYMMTQGGPSDTTDVIGYHIYTEAWTKFLVGIAASKSFLLFLALIIVSYMQFRITKGQMEAYSAT